MTGRARTVFLGSGAFGVETLRYLEGPTDLPLELVGVVTAPPRPAGRGGRLTPTPIDAAAHELGVETVLRPERLRSPDAIADVLALRPELAILADYGQIVPRPILDLAHGALNLHPSLLPRHRGASPIAATILAGDAETGVTLIKMDEDLDTGPIVAQKRRRLAGTETAAELEELLGEVDAPALLQAALDPWLRGEIEPRPQPAEGATLTRPLRRENGRLNPSLPAIRLERQVRAYQPWPGSFLDTVAGRVAVWRAAVLPAGNEFEVGRLVAPGEERDRLALVTADGLLELLEVQPAAGRRMTAAELLRGRPQLVGTIIGPVPPAGSGR